MQRANLASNHTLLALIRHQSYYTKYYTNSIKTYPMCVFSSNETEIIKHCISIVSQFFCRSRLVKTAGPIIIFDRHFNRQIFSSNLTVFLDLQFGKVSFSLPVHPKMLTWTRVQWNNLSILHPRFTVFSVYKQ